MAETLGRLEAELDAIDALIEDAAARETAAEYLRLMMRRAALPKLIREERAAPLRAQLERLDAELHALVQEMERAKDEPAPDVPGHLKGTVTPGLLRQQKLGNIAQRQRGAGQERRELLRRIEAIAGEEGRPL